MGEIEHIQKELSRQLKLNRAAGHLEDSVTRAIKAISFLHQGCVHYSSAKDSADYCLEVAEEWIAQMQIEITRAGEAIQKYKDAAND